MHKKYKEAWSNLLDALGDMTISKRECKDSIDEMLDSLETSSTALCEEIDKEGIDQEDSHE